MRILITGPQGSGKTTQAKIISERYKLCLVKTGDMVRALAQEDSEEGQHIREKSLHEGVLIDDTIPARLVKGKVESKECAMGFVVDGYPRRLSQLERYDPHYEYAFYLDISDNVAEERMLHRGRIDDTKELIDKRLEVYHKETTPVIDYYRNFGILHVINAEVDMDEVTAQIEEILDGKDKK